jgi:hypothetical protein
MRGPEKAAPYYNCASSLLKPKLGFGPVAHASREDEDSEEIACTEHIITIFII